MTVELWLMILQDAPNPVNKVEGGLDLASRDGQFIQDS